MARSALLALLLVGVALPAHAQTVDGGASGQGASTVPVLRYGSELLLGRSHAQGGRDAGGAGRGQDRERVVLRRHGAETMPAIQAGQIGQAARLRVQEPERPNNNRLLTGGGGKAGGGLGQGRIIPFGAERTVEGSGGGAGGQGGERPRFAAFPPRQAVQGEQGQRPNGGVERDSRWWLQTAPARPQQHPRPGARAQSAPTLRQQDTLPLVRQAPPPPANAFQGSLSGGNRFSDIAHEGLPTPPALSEDTRAALDRLNPRQQEAYRASIRDITRRNPRRTLSEPEVRLLIEAAQNR